MSRPNVVFFQRDGLHKVALLVADGIDGDSLRTAHAALAARGSLLRARDRSTSHLILMSGTQRDPLVLSREPSQAKNSLDSRCSLLPLPKETALP